MCVFLQHGFVKTGAHTANRHTKNISAALHFFLATSWLHSKVRALAQRGAAEVRLCKRMENGCKVSVRVHSCGGDYIHPAPAASGRTGTLQYNLRLNSCSGSSAEAVRQLRRTISIETRPDGSLGGRRVARCVDVCQSVREAAQDGLAGLWGGSTRGQRVTVGEVNPRRAQHSFAEALASPSFSSPPGRDVPQGRGGAAPALRVVLSRQRQRQVHLRCPAAPESAAGRRHPGAEGGAGGWSR